MSQTDFDQVAGAYDESLPPHVVGHYLEKRVAFIRAHARAGARILDVGCGTGALAERLAGAGYEVSGVDPSAGMLAILRRRAPQVGAEVGSGTELPYAEGSFDFVYCVAVMHHIADPLDVRRTLVEMVRVAKPGGLILVWDHNPRNPYWKLLMARVPQDTGEERLIGEREILAGLRAGGAEPLLVERSGLVPDFTPPSLLGAAAAIERGAERTPGLRTICAHNVILARKPAA